MYEISKLPPAITLGYQGESLARTIEVDCTDWLSDYPAGTMAATILLPGYDGVAPLPVDMDGAVMSIPVTRGMTVKAGRGSINLKLLDGEVEKRSAVVPIYIQASHPPVSGEMPDPVQDWVSAAQAKLGEVDHFVDDAQTATDAANAAAVRAENGENERENAEGLRVIAEQGRHDAYALAEAARDGLYDAAEAARDGLYDAAESNRDGLFNTSQTERTNAYNLRENQRDDAYSQAESARDGLYAAAELIREGAETARETAEGLREGAETARETAEGLRAEAEGLREQGETNRGNAYSQAESARDGLYATAESARDGLYATAESARDGLFEAAETTRNAQTGDAIDRANTIAETLEGIAPKWADVDISVSALSEGTDPTASITQDETGTSISLGIPKGDKGDTGNVMYATFDIDFDTGELVMTIPDGYTGPTFSINDETGELEVSI